MSIFRLKKHSFQVRYGFSEVFILLQNHMNHPSILLGDFNMSTADLQDKLTDNYIDNWFIFPSNGSPISWTWSRYLSDIDHAIVNSSMLEKISSAYFVNYPSKSDHKHSRSLLRENYHKWIIFVTKKKIVWWDKV